MVKILAFNKKKNNALISLSINFATLEHFNFTTKRI